MRALPLVPILLLFAAPALAFDNTATVAGNPPFYDGPGYDYTAQGRLPAGATVTLEQCTPDGDTPFPGYPRRRHTDGSFCLIRGAGWVDAAFLVGMRAKVNVTDPSSISTPPNGLLGGSSLSDQFGVDFFGDQKNPQ
ncbi:hypothetical protein [Devosia sp.]|uniref:hypothetical protein n=1 Tax=Devosia sp. TaxID=1871048 RepID=UPI003263E05E